MARDFVAARIPAKFVEYDAALARNAFRTVFLLRLIFWMPQFLHSFFGVSNGAVLDALLGLVPRLPAAALSHQLLRREMIDEHGSLQPKAFPVMGGLFAASLVLMFVMRRFERAARPS